MKQPPKYLMEMPYKVLFGQAKAIEAWCKEHDKVPPTLWDLGMARRARRQKYKKRK